MKKDISFIVPMYNAEEYLERTLNSIVEMVGEKQNKVEVLLIDDGSSDETVMLAENFSTNYDFFKVIPGKHQGVSGTRNTGIKLAKGEYVTFIDSDDTFRKNFVTIFESLITEKPDIVLADIEVIKHTKSMMNLTIDQKIALFKLINRGRGNTGIGSKFFKRSFLEKYALMYDSQIMISEDALFNYQAIDKATSVVLTPEEFYYVLASHTLPYYNPNILTSELRYRKQTAKIFAKYYPYDENGELLWTDNKIKLLGYIKLVDRYYGPLYIKKEISLSEATKKLREIAENFDYTGCFKSKAHDNVLGMRYIVFRNMLKCKLYRTTLVFNKYMDRIKKTQRWK